MTAPYATNHVMVDLETLDTQPTAVVLSIGAVRFDPNDHDSPLKDTFYRVLSSNDQFELERSTSTSTVSWWAGQSEEARKVLDEAATAEDEVHLQLMEFAEWLGKDALVWGNGPAFDNTVLADLYRQYEIRQPWSFRNDRCFRTLCMLGQRRMTQAWLHKLGPEPTRAGTYHNALDDAKHQAIIACRYLRVL